MTEWMQALRPELFVLIPVLYVLGEMLKKSPVADWKIPYLLCGAGCFLSLLYFAGRGAEACGGWLPLLFTSLTQGSLCASCSVYAKNLYKQWKERDGAPSDGTG